MVNFSFYKNIFYIFDSVLFFAVSIFVKRIFIIC